MPFNWVIAGGLVALVLAPAACRNSTKQRPKPAELVLAAPDPALALAGLRREQPIPARLETSEGPIHCTLDAQRAPRSVALFVGLATGRANFRDLQSGATVSRPFYRDQAFFRAIPDLLLQSGCPVGNGTGTPGYRIAVEPSDDDAQRLAKPGVLFLARYHPAPNRVDPNPPPPGEVIGSQFVISLGDMSHLAGAVSVLGACEDLDRVRAATRLVASGAHPVRLTQIVIAGANDAH
ncbi:MAG: peptidylprolyl isomerase [Polyangiaceae bacterium]